MDPEIIAGRLWVKAKIRELVEANEAPVRRFVIGMLPASVWLTWRAERRRRIL